MMLMALALLRPGGMVEDTRMTEAAYEEAASVAPQDEVYKITAAIAPILLPLIEHLSALREEDF